MYIYSLFLFHLENDIFLQPWRLMARGAWPSITVLWPCYTVRYPIEEETDDEDDEPKLKYQRLGASIAEILQDRAATCLAVAGKVRALLLLLPSGSFLAASSAVFIVSILDLFLLFIFFGGNFPSSSPSPLHPCSVLGAWYRLGQRPRAGLHLWQQVQNVPIARRAGQRHFNW